jgi:hypothetical protein
VSDDFVPETDYTNTSKPYDVRQRPFHRINAPDYDTSVDPPDPAQPAPGRRLAPSGLGRDCGCRGPEDLLPSTTTALLATYVIDALNQAANLLIPFKRMIDAGITEINEILQRYLKTPDYIKQLKDDLAKLLAGSAEVLVFGRMMRAIPQWVPVGRRGYARDHFQYDDKPPGMRQAGGEQEREVEGMLLRSFQMATDLPQLQWTRFARWAFHLKPMPGYRYLVGKGNVQSRDENEVLASANEPLEPVVPIYGYGASPCIECLMDAGAFSLPPGDTATPDQTVPGVMFNSSWPFWPQAGDHVWAAGRWAYDCTRVIDNTLFPTQLNPLKAIATARYEGFKFAANPASAPAVRFFFFATSEGGYVDFRTGQDRKGQSQAPPFRLRDRDYQFIVDLPPAPRGRDRHPVGHTPGFRANTLALRATLLREVQQAREFVGADAGTDASWARDVTVHDIEPVVEVVRPVRRTDPPSQVRITVPLSQLEGADDAPVACGFVLNLGWHDPAGDSVHDLVKVTVELEEVRFTQDATVRFKTAINGRWSSAGLTGEAQSGHGRIRPKSPGGAEVFYLPRDGVLKLSASGTRRHGFGEYREEPSPERVLTVGGLLDIKKSFWLDVLHALEDIPIIRIVVPDSIKATAKMLEDLVNNVPDELLGPRYPVDWNLDVDTDQDQSKDGTSNARASAVARELTLHPTPIINLADEPLGFLESYDDPSHAIRIGIPADPAPAPGDAGWNVNLLDMKVAVQQLTAANQRSLTSPIVFWTSRTQAIGGGNLLAAWAAPRPGPLAGVIGTDDYTLKGRMTVELL